ncbi:PREDICTED: uncharacterized protein LOC106751574 [Dinoponera quadriceps]|uniref:Uncharacterized protein LOC106751574 n=1 Tax=Dinoponera quadriceps TaxID=609295 RepID=A0A6P3YAH0_DINQU|nr:PREDICTED: uncharacterized protein LOC106751574 [Dinoponera quadriceps]
MLESEVLKSPDNDGRENKGIDNSRNLKSERDMITGSASDKKFVYLKHQVEFPGTFYSLVPHGRKNFRHQINRSLNFGINPSRRGNLSRLSPNVSMDNGRSSINKSPRDLSRSAQIMRALSKNHDSFRYTNESIKRTLTFDSSPSPSKKSNSSEESTSVDSIVNTPLHTPDKFVGPNRNSTDTSTSSGPTESSESIDENQNRTPQQNRLVSKVLIGSSDTKSNKSGSPSSTSMLRSNLREKINKITCNTSVPHVRTQELQCFKRGDRLRVSSCDIAASTPRNLFKEFNQDEEDSSHTPINTMRFIPESMSSIKKSHKKERAHSLGGKDWQVDDSVKSQSSCAKRPVESLEANDILTSSSSCMVTVKDSPKKIRNVKKALVYDLDDELSDKESISDYAEQGVVPKNIDSSDSMIYEENKQDIDDTLPSTSSTSNHNNKENDSYSQKASSNNIDLAEHENKEISLEPNSAVSKDSKYSRLMHRIKFSINDPITLRSDEDEAWDDCEIWRKRFEIITATPVRNIKMSDVQDTTEKLNTTQNNDMIHPRNERPITPENINSSRLLLSQFTSVKKSHKEDKRKYKSLFGIPICDAEDKETFRKVLNLLADDLFTEVNSEKSRNASFPVRLSPDKSKKKKRFMSRSLLSNEPDDLPQLAEPLLTGCENIGDEPNTYIRNRVSSILLSLKNHMRRGKASSGEISDNEPVKAADATDENGRLTPINMSTAELLCNKDSIKKSHKKDKHDASLRKRRIPRKNLSEDGKETADMNFADYTKTPENYTTPSLKLNPNDDSLCDKTEACSSMRNENNKKNNENNIYDPQPSTSRGNIIESKEDTKKLKPLSTTPPNSLNTLKLMKLLHTTSIKKSHKKERHLKKQSKYILMNKEHDLSDDGSIFDEEDILTSGESFSLFPNNKN